MKHKVRLHRLQAANQVAQVVHVAFDQLHLPEHLDQVLPRAPPTAEAIDLPVRFGFQNILGQVAADETGNARDQYLHVRCVP